MNIQELIKLCAPKKLTVAQEAKELLKNIKPEDWLQGTWYLNDGEKACAIGHYNMRKHKRIHSAPDNLLTPLSEKFLKPHHTNIIGVNDGASCGLRYTEEHPKDRVMHLLDDMIAAGL